MLTLTVGNPNAEHITYQLYDVNGKLLQQGKLTDTETSISMQEFVSATYLLTVLQNGTKTKTFQIIKN